MPRNKVQIAVTFVTIKPGNKPILCIENPIPLVDKIGSISSYNKLNDAINYLVDDGAQSLFFHNDARHRYTFDGSSIQNGAIYGRREMKWDEEGGKATARHLLPIQS